MAKTLLAVDDSVTMRKVLEITFSGEDFRVITAENAQGALGGLGEHPAVFVVDSVLGGEDGYALAKELRKRSPHAAIVMLASRYAPYDPIRGRDAGADDWTDKPFDTQQLIDKVRKALATKEAGGGQPSTSAAVPLPQAAPVAPVPDRAPAPPQPSPHVTQVAHAPPQFAQAPPVPVSSGIGRSTQPLNPETAHAARSGTLVFGEGTGAARPGQAAAAPAVSPPVLPSPAAAAAAPSPIGAAVHGQLAGKLGDLGLSAQQADAVLALSRDVVERIVWEVVPQLAEAMIKEEIRRLTA